jgi:ABC-2 type transport system ATP-binding protein
MDALIIFDTVFCKIGKKTILEQITLSIEKGEITGILGPNGAGKSTLLSLINGLRKHSKGTITLFGEKLPAKGANLRKRIGVVLQETALYEELTTFENLRFSASLYNVANPTAKIIEVLELLKLSDRADQTVRTLSGGLRRRVAIARALIHDPELLIIDEPTVGVDVETRHAIWQHLRLLKSRGRTVIVASNYLDEAQALCDTVVVLKDGKVIAHETPHELVMRAGYCLDVECSEEEGIKIKTVLQKEPDVLLMDQTLSGLSIFLKSDSVQKNIMDGIVKNAQIEGFRVRAPDLVEVFKALEKKI